MANPLAPRSSGPRRMLMHTRMEGRQVVTSGTTQQDFVVSGPILPNLHRSVDDVKMLVPIRYSENRANEFEPYAWVKVGRFATWRTACRFKWRSIKVKARAAKSRRARRKR